jgi:U3 small nucleolar RNA-associated protein 11
VLSFPNATSYSSMIQKIEKLRDRLKEIADLFAPSLTDDVHQADDAAGLDEEELEILREAGVIAGTSKVERKRRSSQPQAKHIVFVENEEEGMYRRSLLARVYALIPVAAQQYITKQIDLPSSRSERRGDVDAIDLGWRKPEKKKSQKKKKKAVGASDSADVSEEREAAKVSFPCARLSFFFFLIQRKRRYIGHVC